MYGNVLEIFKFIIKIRVNWCGILNKMYIYIVYEGVLLRRINVFGFYLLKILKQLVKS